MSIKRLSGAGLTTPKSNKLWDQTTFQSGMFALATVSLTSSQSSVTFSGIPSNYTHLHLRITTRNDKADNGGQSTVMYLNGDTTYTNYRSHLLYGTASAGYSESNQLSGYYGAIGYTAGGNMTANVHSTQIIDMLDYANTSKNKTVRTSWGLLDSDSNGYCGLSSFLWTSTSAITSFSIISYPSANFVLGSQFALYGIKAAS
jgi:hypothetical protein